MITNPKINAIVAAILILAGLSQPNAIAEELPKITENNTNTPITDIELAYGYGVTINFTPVGETITNIWIDNPSFVTVTVDGCLTGLSVDECGENEGASLLHLRRIQDLDLPQLPKTQGTLMTVVTTSTEGVRVYLFNITKADRVSTVNLIIDIVE
ncbi:hypothetical protein [Coleofasciculus sp. E1-EBD-02]|jgi:hypothetical protein|uniref:hypothetical protein n=1 Tax=Coleofasciculus sp. E1-EBD-02 TaxID=3068481 RepID=UPI0032FC238B